MKIIKSFSLLLLLAAPHACAMQEIIISSTIDDVKNIVYKENPVEEAALLLKVAESHGKKPLYVHTAILADNIPALDIFLQANPPKEQDAKQRTPLHCAFDEDNTGAITTLFKYPAMQECNLTGKARSKKALLQYCQEVERVYPRDKNPAAWIAMTAAITPPCNDNRTVNSILSGRREITQEFIDKGYVYIPESANNYHDKTYIDVLRTLLAASKKKEISLPDDICLKAQQHIISYELAHEDGAHLCGILHEFKEQADNPALSPLLKKVRYEIADFYAYEYIKADKSNMKSKHYESRKNDILARLTPDVKEHFDKDNNLTWELYKHALANNDLDVITKVRENTSIMDNPTTEWDNGLAMFRELNGLDSITALKRVQGGIAKIHVIAHLDPAFFKRAMNRRTANLLHDVSNKYSSGLVCVYDYVSDDRSPWRQYDPFYHYRKCTDPRLSATYLDRDNDEKKDQ